MKSRWHLVALIALALAICVAGAVAAWSSYSSKEKAPPQIVQGDGVKGPTGLAQTAITSGKRTPPAVQKPGL